MKHSLLTLLLLSSFTLPALAEDNSAPLPPPPVDQREANQEKRIEQGKESGALTNHEAKKLERRQKRIEGAEAKAMGNDGKIGKHEARHLNRMQNRASREIYRKKHNARKHR
ncbi:MAG TPA: hypothetical protein VIH99_00175 [Bdellovibrionota bacterium]|jgi:hypothetical protein